jgi:hypothetical protein
LNYCGLAFRVAGRKLKKPVPFRMYRLGQPLEGSRHVSPPPDTETFPNQGSTDRFVVVEAQVVEDFDRFKKQFNFKEKKCQISEQNF